MWTPKILFLVLYLSRVAYDFIPAKPTALRAETHILYIKLSYYAFILIQMYVLLCVFYLVICKDIIWVYIAVHVLAFVHFVKVRWDTVSGLPNFTVTFAFTVKFRGLKAVIANWNFEWVKHENIPHTDFSWDSSLFSFEHTNLSHWSVLKLLSLEGTSE